MAANFWASMRGGKPNKFDGAENEAGDYGQEFAYNQDQVKQFKKSPNAYTKYMASPDGVQHGIGRVVNIAKGSMGGR